MGFMCLHDNCKLSSGSLRAAHKQLRGLAWMRIISAAKELLREAIEWSKLESFIKHMSRLVPHRRRDSLGMTPPNCVSIHQHSNFLPAS